MATERHSKKLWKFFFTPPLKNSEEEFLKLWEFFFLKNSEEHFLKTKGTLKIIPTKDGNIFA